MGWMTLSGFPETVLQSGGQNTINGNWHMVFFHSPEFDPGVLFPEKQPYMRLDSSTLRASGSTGCNRFSGQFVAVNQQFRFAMDKMILTRMACKGPGEGIFLETIGRVNRYRLTNDTLVFLQNDTVLIRWKKKN
ncbi:hypothetical protein BC349_09050 [Flavihumibacter stibioxidans]|uniref:DUF306 domain-containing protein n=2 Tax=Flavihumibacter stibioxidans TaxID=1834163 RepID=A0ABR7M897_9BACT|nr:hypothetical protein [Flavihumibacter stibioxidans]